MSIGIARGMAATGTPRRRLVLALAVAALAALVGPTMSVASSGGAVVTLKTVKVGAPGNPSVGIVPFTDAVYRSCDEAPASSAGCLSGRRGQVPLRHRSARDHRQAVGGLPQHGRSDRSQSAPSLQPTESPSAWPRFGQIDFSSGAGKGHHYSVASPEWAAKPYGFANFLRAARFVNSLYNGQPALQTRQQRRRLPLRQLPGAALEADRERDVRHRRAKGGRDGPTRSRKSGFVLPSQNEWIKAAYYDPNGGGTYSYWKYPTNAGVFGDGTATAPTPTTLDPTNGDVTNALDAAAGDLPRLRSGGAELVPGGRATAGSLRDRQPLRDRRRRPTTRPTRAASARSARRRPPRPGAPSTRAATWSSGPTRSPPSPTGQERRPGLAPPPRRHRQRPRLPALALGGRAAAAGQRRSSPPPIPGSASASACSATSSSPSTERVPRLAVE